MKTFTPKSILAVAVLFTFISPSLGMACECIVSGETKSAKIELPGEIHCYTFWGEAGQGVAIQMGAYSASDSVHVRLQLYDPDGIQVVDWPGYAVAKIDNYQMKKTGTYTIVVSDVYGVAAGEYGLSLVVAPGATTSPQDRDGGEVLSGEIKSGTISPGADTDAFEFYGQVNQGVVIQVAVYSASSSVHVRLQLYDPDGIQVVDWPGYAVAEIDNYQLKKTGMYTIVVSDVYGMAAGAYGLSVSVMPPKNPYGLYPYHPLPVDGNSVSLCDWSTLSWWPVDGATGYDVYFAGSPCMPLGRIAENVTEPWVPMPIVEGGQVCYWRVVAHTPSGDIKGPTWWFVAETASCCDLIISVVGRGSIVDPNGQPREYSCGEVVPVTAVADPNYEFVRWEGSAVDAGKVAIERQDPTGSKVLVTVDGPYTLRAVFEEVLFDFPLDVDPGWTRDGQWEFGAPTGRGGQEHGNSDPTTGRTGQNVFGVNLNGDYDVRIGGPYCLVAGPFDLRGYTSVRLSFWSWLNTDWADYVKNSLEMSLDGKTWLLVSHNPQRQDTVDNAWSRWECGIGTWADDQPAVYLRWSYQVLAERAYPYSGWNLDDIQLCGRRR